MFCFDDFFAKKNFYCFNNCWNICAPASLVWNELTCLDQWPGWFHGMEKIQTPVPTALLQRGQSIELMIKGDLPYSLCFEMVINNFIEYSFVSFTVRGDLNGKGVCRLLPFKNGSTIHFSWNVSPARLWMKMGSAFARNVFIRNHDQIVEHSINNFKQCIAKKLNNVELPGIGDKPEPGRTLN